MRSSGDAGAMLSMAQRFKFDAKIVWEIEVCAERKSVLKTFFVW